MSSDLPLPSLAGNNNNNDNNNSASPDLRRSDADDAALASPARKKQKRNKPTLSCDDCVERKTKNKGAKARRNKHGVGSGATSSGLPSPVSHQRSGSSSSTNSSPFLLSNLAHSRQVSGSVFGSGALHPFANYWTTTGGVPEVVGVLPDREQADSLVAKYFDSVDPVYPMINRAHFMADYNQFWLLPLAEKHRADPSMLALTYAVFAMGAQFISTGSEQARAQIAQFYVSAAHQCLRLYPFLSRTSLRTIQAMILMDYFLMNDNRATDAWAFGGILVRQAYAMGLNRDPNLIIPAAPALDKQQRLKVWQAVYFQDTFLTVLLKLPPTTTFSDCTVNSLTDDPPDPAEPPCILSYPAPPINTNPMSISNIAPPHVSLTVVPAEKHTDVDYFRSMWRLADLVQTSVSTPRALTQPVATSPRQKAAIVQRFHDLHSSFPPSLTTNQRDRFQQLLKFSPRMARQNLFLRSNYWHCLMLVEADASEAHGVRCNIRDALEAGRVALNSFFDFWEFLQVDAAVWWVFQHRAFEEALTMSYLLAAYSPTTSPISPGHPSIDPLAMDARADVQRMLAIVEHIGNAAPEMQKTRTDVLRKAVEAIRW